ncbi:MAG: NFACT family protein, partial [Nanoarchaeota archaeon]|nr:NFACT family protein [Nanoarchaeota archaeon]
QLDLERIIELDLETKERKYKLVMELFSRGNLIICDEEYTIYSAMETQVWSERTVKAKLKYTYPKREHNILEITKQALQELLERSDKANMVKTLATDLGIGGLYAEEICLLAEIDKNKNAKKLSGPEIKRLFESIKRLREQKLKAMQILDDQDEVLDIIPIELDCYSKQNKKQFASFNEALDKFFTPHEAEKKKQAVTKQITTKLDKITVMINEQNKRISGLERSAAENQRKGELMFEHYTEINDILKKIIELRKKHSWAEIKEMLKNEKMIKNIDEKKGELVVEIE